MEAAGMTITAGAVVFIVVVVALFWLFLPLIIHEKLRRIVKQNEETQKLLRAIAASNRTVAEFYESHKVKVE